MYTCVKCLTLFPPTNHSRICNSCRRTTCVTCGVPLQGRSDKEFCGPCKKKHNVYRAQQNYWNNLERKKEYDRNRGSIKHRFAKKLYRMRHPGEVNYSTSLRRALQRKACPKWANRFFMAEIYRLAALRTKVLKTRWVVDHIIPLRGVSVCGLHVKNNLQVVPEAYNLRKSNKLLLNIGGN